MKVVGISVIYMVVAVFGSDMYIFRKYIIKLTINGIYCILFTTIFTTNLYFQFLMKF